MNKKFKIGIDARMYGPQQTGIGTYIQYLIDYLAKIDKNNDYFIFLLPDTIDSLILLGENFKKIKVTSHWYSTQEQVFFLRDLLKHKLDLVHFPHFNLPILYRGKYITTIHDITPKFFPGHKMGQSWYKRKAYDLILKVGTKKAKHIITPSEKTKRDLIDFYNAKKDRITVIYEGIKNKNTADQRKEFIENYTQNKEVALKNLQSKFNLKNLRKPYIFYVGVWREHKNLPNLIRAFDILIKKYNFQGDLVLGGTEDPYYPETREELKKRGLENRIIRPGFLYGEKLNLLYQAADVFVLPSLYEGFGLVTIEALNQGTAVACSNIDPLKEVLKNSSVYFDPHNPEDIASKLNELLQDKRLQIKLLMQAQGILEKYDWQEMAKKTLMIYKSVLENRERC